MPATTLRRLILIITTLLCMPVCVADTYKWIDTDGNVVYSEIPPSGGQPVETLKRLTPVEIEPEAKDEQTQALEEVEEQTNERKARIKENCDVARYNKALLETTANIVEPGSEGDELLTASQKEQRLSQAKSNVDIYCD